MQLLRILTFIFLVPGFSMVFASRWVVNRYKLDKNIKSDFEHEMGEDELNQYKLNKAMVNFKMLGMLVALPGLILFIIAFK